MKEVETVEIVRCWIALHHAKEHSEEYKENFWAFDKVSDLCRQDPHECWRIINLIKQQDSGEKILSNLAAGPLEELLSIHGDKLIDVIEEQAKSDPLIKKMLGAVWENDIPQDIWRRLQSVAGPSW